MWDTFVSRTTAKGFLMHPFSPHKSTGKRASKWALRHNALLASWNNICPLHCDHIGAWCSGKLEQCADCSTHRGIIVAHWGVVGALLWSATLGRATLRHSRYNVLPCGMQPQMLSQQNSANSFGCCSALKGNKFCGHCYKVSLILYQIFQHCASILKTGSSVLALVCCCCAFGWIDVVCWHTHIIWAQWCSPTICKRQRPSSVY